MNDQTPAQTAQGRAEPEVRRLDPASLRGPVWVAAPHPDDESLGCGALLATLCDLGIEVWALLLTDGGASHPGSGTWSRSRLADQRLQEWHAALQLLGVPPEHRMALALPDGALPSPGDPGGQGAVLAVRQAFSRAQPGTVLLPWRRDPHPDHRAAHALLTAALVDLPPARQLEYTVWLQERGAPEDQPQPGEARVWEAVSPDQRARKEAAIRAHHSQLGELIHDDPDGFVLQEDMIARALNGPERLLEVES